MPSAGTEAPVHDGRPSPLTIVGGLMGGVFVVVGVVAVAVFGIYYLVMTPNELPRFDESGGPVELPWLGLRADLPSNIHVREHNGWVGLSETCYDRGSKPEQCHFRYPNPTLRLRTSGAPSSARLQEIGEDLSEYEDLREYESEELELVYRHLNAPGVESLEGFARVGPRWLEFDCSHEHRDNGLAARGFCLSVIAALEPEFNRQR